MNEIEILTFGFLDVDKNWQNLWSRFSNRIAKGYSL